MQTHYFVNRQRINEGFRHVLVRGRYVHIDGLGEIISSFNRPIVIECEHVDFPFYFRGSSCLLKFKNRFFVATCFHHLADIGSSWDNMFVQARLGGGMQFNIPLSKAYTPKKEFRNTDDCLDLAFFETKLGELFSERIESEFFDITEDSSCSVPMLNEPILVCGFPYSKGTSTDYENKRISRPAVVVDGRFVRWSNEPHLFYCRTLDNPAGSISDGFSGGGAFGLRQGSNGIEVFFSGIIVRGGGNYFYAISHDFIRRSLNNIIVNS